MGKRKEEGGGGGGGGGGGDSHRVAFIDELQSSSFEREEANKVLWRLLASVLLSLYSALVRLDL